MSSARERADGSDESFDLSRGIRLGIGAAGITGVLALFGFLVNVARADLLGVDLGVGGVANLAQSAGNFLLDSMLLALQSWSALVSFAILALLFLGLRYYSPAHRGPRNLTPRVAAWAEALLVLAALTSVLIEYELPAVRVRDVLIGNDICNHVTNRPDLISERADFLWALYAHSKGYKNGCASLDTFSALHKDVVKLKDDARSALNNIHAMVVAVVCAGWVAFAASSLKQASRSLQALEAAGGLALLFSTVLLPYSWGKLIADTSVPRAELVGKPRAGAAPGTVDRLDVFILAEADRTLLFASFDQTLCHVLEWPKDGMDHYEIKEIADVLEERMVRWAAAPPPPPPPPPPLPVTDRK